MSLPDAQTPTPDDQGSRPVPVLAPVGADTGTAAECDDVTTGSAELHVFHYATYSTVWGVDTEPVAGCQSATEHLHTPDGRDLLIVCGNFVTREDAEDAITDIVIQHIADLLGSASAGDDLGPIEVIRHRDDAAPLRASAHRGRLTKAPGEGPAEPLPRHRLWCPRDRWSRGHGRTGRVVGG